MRDDITQTVFEEIATGGCVKRYDIGEECDDCASFTDCAWWDGGGEPFPGIACWTPIPLSAWDTQVEELALAEASAAEEMGRYQDGLLRAAHRYEEAHRPLVRAAFTTGHAVGCECGACIDAREEPAPVATRWPGPARSRRLNGGRA